MSLSNWDCLAFGPDAKASSGVFKNGKARSQLEIYKNWVYLRSPSMWTEGSRFIRPTIAQINSGESILAGFDIETTRDAEQSSIFVHASYRIAKCAKHFAGIGCCGYLDEIPIYLNALKLPKGDWGTMTKCGPTQNTDQHFIVKYGAKKPTQVRIPAKLYIPPTYIGVSETTVKRFFNWLYRLSKYDPTFRDWVNACKATKHLRYNQGDAYLASNLDCADSVATEVGKAQETMFSSFIKGMKK